MPTRKTLVVMVVCWGLCLSCAGGTEESPKSVAIPPRPAPSGAAVASGTAVASGAASAPAPATQPVDPLAWPRQFQKDGNSFAIYQPQLEKWEGDRLEAQAAV